LKNIYLNERLGPNSDRVMPCPHFGNYPVEYNRAIHGPYDPAKYYGKRMTKIFIFHYLLIYYLNNWRIADTPLSEVKLSELSQWINRRNFHPSAIVRAISRAHQRWMHRFAHPCYASPAIAYHQLIVLTCIWSYLILYPKTLRKFYFIFDLRQFLIKLNLFWTIGHHKQYKYHW
jgi:F-type H+-transporting ATPase subunit f